APVPSTLIDAGPTDHGAPPFSDVVGAPFGGAPPASPYCGLTAPADLAPLPAYAPAPAPPPPPVFVAPPLAPAARAAGGPSMLVVALGAAVVLGGGLTTFFWLRSRHTAE